MEKYVEYISNEVVALALLLPVLVVLYNRLSRCLSYCFVLYIAKGIAFC